MFEISSTHIPGSDFMGGGVSVATMVVQAKQAHRKLPTEVRHQ